jgi:hypothetical protein
MEEPRLYRRVRNKWHVIALRFAVMGLPLLAYNVAKPLADALKNLLHYLTFELPNPQVEEWVPFEQLSKKRQREIELMNGTLAARFW